MAITMPWVLTQRSQPDHHTKGSNRMLDLKRRVWLLAYAPLFVWIGVTFFLSSNLGSSAHPSLIIEPLLKFFFPDISKASLQFAHACVRKTAHFTEYGILALL